MGMFSLGKDGAQSAAKSARFSFVGPEMNVTGDIVTTGDLHVDGKVTGDVRCGALTQGQTGEVKGNIFAGEARLAGLVDGAVEAGVLTLEHSARITGDILYETLSIASGADVEGRFKRKKGAGDGSSGARAETVKPLRKSAAAASSSASLFSGETPAAEAAE
jgi:cytoskeletal protein CcmA (bactofilin family)